MEISVHHDGDTTVVEIIGNLTAGDPEKLLEAETGRLLETGKHLIAMDMADVEYVDSSGLGALIRCQRLCAEHAAEMELRGVNPRIKNLLTLARLTDVFTIRED